MSRTFPRLYTLVTLLSCTAPLPAAAQERAIDRYQLIEEMHHTAWTARDGLVGEPTSIVQAPDGYLWIGTLGGLFRFDGVEFEHYRPTKGEMLAVSVSALAAAPDGGIWVGHSRGGVSYIAPDGTVTQYTTADGLPVSKVRSIAVDHDGTVWLAAVGGLARFADGRWQTIRMDWNYPGKSAWSVYVEKDGTLWVGAASPDRIVYLPRGSRSFVDMGVEWPSIAFAQLSDSVVACLPRVEPSVYLVRRGAAPLLAIKDAPADVVAMDASGGLWAGGRELFRFRAREADGTFTFGPKEVFTVAQGMTGTAVRQVLIDREGTTWAVTSGGLDRYRRRNLAWVRDTTLDGGASVVAGADGRVWVLSYREPFLRGVADSNTVRGAPPKLNNGVSDGRGSIWLSTLTALYRWDGTAFDSIPSPTEVSAAKEKLLVIAGAMDSTGHFWASLSGFGVYTWKEGQWTFRPILGGRHDLAPIAMSTDAANRVWMAYRDEVAVVHGDSIRTYSTGDGLDLGPLLALETSGSLVWAGGERGLALLHGDRFRTVEAANAQELGTVTGVLTTRDGVWLASSVGIIHLPAAEVQRLVADSTHRVDALVLGVGTELPDPVRISFLSRTAPRVAQDSDGVLWFVTMNGLARVDPRLISTNPLPPPVAIRSVTADDRAIPLTGAVALPPLTRTLRIGYSGLSLVEPSRVRYRHRLEGWEDTWHEAGTRREVSYTDLKPGAYTFRVLASNNDGVWNEVGASLPFSVAPAWYQTLGFKALVLAALTALVVALYQYRLRRVSAALSARFDARLEERTRIARELHDTLLQTVEGSKLVADDALAHTPDTDQLRGALTRVSAWLEQAAQEGRAALHSLRGATPVATDLAAALRSAAVNTASPSLRVNVSVDGVARELHPIPREEAYRICHEAIRNASMHSKATSLDVSLEYGPDLVVRITDDGTGIDPLVAASGKNGRHGLRGMRERAASIGATLTISSAERGTQVILIVPGRIAYHNPAPHAVLS